jgi:hypothetical protein
MRHFISLYIFLFDSVIFVVHFCRVENSSESLINFYHSLPHLIPEDSNLMICIAQSVGAECHPSESPQSRVRLERMGSTRTIQEVWFSSLQREEIILCSSLTEQCSKGQPILIFRGHRYLFHCGKEADHLLKRLRICGGFPPPFSKFSWLAKRKKK